MDPTISPLVSDFECESEESEKEEGNDSVEQPIKPMTIKEQHEFKMKRCQEYADDSKWVVQLTNKLKNRNWKKTNQEDAWNE